MCREFVKKIREEEKNIGNMPERANDVLKYFHIKDISSGVPIIEILTKLGFKIYQSDLSADGLSAYIAVDPKLKNIFGSNKITCVHSEDNIGHKRFALAHELAHYLFDFNEDENLYYYDTYSVKEKNDKIEEKRANIFAANLLMPKEAFIEKFKEYKSLRSKADIVNALEQYFLVSSTSVLKRLRELDINGYNNYME